VTDHVTDTNHSVIRHDHQIGSGIAGDVRPPAVNAGGGGLWNTEQEITARTRYNYIRTHTAAISLDRLYPNQMYDVTVDIV